MKDNFYTFDVSTIISNTCTVKARSKEEAIAIVKDALKNNLDFMMESATFEDTIEGPYDPSQDAIDDLKEYPSCDITWRC